MTATEAAPAPAPAHPRWLVKALIALAALRTGLYGVILPILVISFFTDDRWDTPPLMTAKLIVAPFMAGGALYLATRARLPWAIVLLAALNLVEWVAELPKLTAYDLLTLNNLDAIPQSVLTPICALIAIVLALRDRLLPLAALLASIPLVILLLEAGALGVATGLYGR